MRRAAVRTFFICIKQNFTRFNVTHKQKVTKEVGREYFLQAVGSDPVLLRQDATAASGKHSDNAAAIKETEMIEG